MNHIYKVIWNKAKHCYTVVSEIAKSHSQSNKRVRSMTAVVAAAMMLTGFGGMAIEAANPAPDDTNIKIGKGADFAIWNGQTGHDGITSGYIAIGENAYAWDGEYSFQDYLTRKWSARIGTKEYLLDFNQGAVGSATWGKYRVTDGTKLAGAIAIGKNTMARTGSVMIGDHTYVGKLGDIEVDPAKKMTLNDSVYSTTLGSSSYNSGSMSAVTGAFSIISNKGTSTSYGTQNFGATIYGSLNSIESSSASSHSAGMANSVLGFGNRTQNTNASLVWGTGNEVTNSIENVTFSTKWNKTSASDAQKEIIKAMQSSDQYAGGSVMAIGGGNKADWAIYSQLLGVQNTLTGTEKDVSKLTMINGYKNTVTNAQNTTIIGSNNTATNIQSTIVMGDHNTLEGRNNVISLGNQNTVTANNAVAIGNGTTVKAESGVAIGEGSVADRVAGIKGAFAPDTIPTGEKSTWTSTAGAVSVGEKGKTTRQITNVAAGREATDAVNVAQLQQVASQAAASKTTVSDGTNTTVTSTVAEDGHTDYRVNLNKDLTGIESMTNGSSSIRMGKGGTVTINKKVTIDQSGKISGVAAGEISSTSTDAVNGSQLHAVQQEAGKHTKVVNGSNITVEETDQDGQKTYKVGLKKDLLLGDIGKNVSISGTNGTIETTGSITTKDKIYAANGAKLADIDIKGDTISNGQSSVKLDKEGTVTINDKVNVDKAGQIHNVTAGTADEDAVNVSQLKKQAAASKTTVSDGINTTVTSTVAKDGHTDYKVNLNKDLTGIESISNGSKGQSKIVLNEGYAGMSYGDTNVVLRDNGVYLNGKVNVDKAGQIHNVTAGTADEDAVNVSQLKKQAAASKTTVSDGINTTVTSTVAKDGHTDYKVNLNKDLTGIESISNGLSSIRMGNGGTVTINNRVTIDQSGKISGVAAGEVKEGSTDAVNGSQLKGVENKADKNAENIQKNTEAIAKNTADISKNAEAISKNTENIKNNSKAIAENAKNIQKNTEAIAKNTADISKNTEAIGKLDERVTSVEEVAKKHTTVSTDDKNVQISEDTNKDGGKDYKVSLNKDLNLSSVTTGDTKMDTNGVTVKDVSLTKDGLSIGNKTYVSNKGLNANDQKVTNVAAGDISEKSTDAVNGSQLFATNQQVVQNAQSISKLGNRINKVGAGAAALAALHPLDFDPDDKWDIAAGYGNYNGENAAAIGAYYRPNEDTMFSVGGSFGNGENMVNAGVSLKLGQGNHVSTSKVAMAKEIKDLRKELEGLKSALLDVNAGKKLDTSKLQLFPDVPKNHWAYEYVSTLKGNGVLTGYPDGEFKGDRPMTRYEFATMLYKAMLEGATLSDRILKEFAPELERFTVDTVHQDKDGKPTVERVRTVKAEK